MFLVEVIRLSPSYPSFLSLVEVKGRVHGTYKKRKGTCFWHTDVVNGGVDSLNWCSVFKIKENGLTFACFSVFKCFLCVGNTVILC